VAIRFYHYQQPHGSIDYLMPIDAHFRFGELKRRWKNYYSRKGQKALEEIFNELNPLVVPFHKEGIKNCKLYLVLARKAQFMRYAHSENSHLRK
jgi:hypothetical protein